MKSILLIFTLILLPTTDQADWTFDFEAAKITAKESDKVILIVFSGSDWCKPCIQLHRTLFESETFIDFAKEKLILVKADFPYRKKNSLSKEQTAHNENLASIYNPNGEFPLAAFTNAKGDLLGTFGYDKTKSPSDYIFQFNQFLK